MIFNLWLKIFNDSFRAIHLKNFSKSGIPNYKNAAIAAFFIYGEYKYPDYRSPESSVCDWR